MEVVTGASKSLFSHGPADGFVHRRCMPGTYWLTLLPPGQAGRRVERANRRFEFWCPMGSFQLWLPRGQAHVESSLPSGLVPMEAAIGSYKSLNKRIIILLALALRSARPGGSSVASEIAGCIGFCTPMNTNRRRC